MEKSFVFDGVPASLEELQSMKDFDFSCPYKTAAFSVLALCNYKNSPEAVHEMLDFLMGPASISNHDKQFIRDRLSGKDYLPFSYFEGASPENNYVPSMPLTIKISDNPYSDAEKNYKKLFIKSSGADSERPIVLRLKPSSQEWFLHQQFLLAGIRIPVEKDPWA